MKFENQQKLKQTLGVLILTATIAWPLSSSLAAPTASKPAAKPVAAKAATALDLGKAALVQKNYAKAVEIYDAASKTEQYKNSCECRLGLGKSLCSLGASQKGPAQASTYKRAAKELRTAIRLGRGSANSLEANRVLLTKLPSAITAPKMGSDTPMIAMAHGLQGRDRSMGGDSKPKILEFTASWCEPCKQLKPIWERAKTAYGDKVEFLSYDIDDPKSEKIIDDYEVSPIPTLIFLDSSNQVITYSIGFSGENGIKAGIKKIVPQS